MNVTKKMPAGRRRAGDGVTVLLDDAPDFTVKSLTGQIELAAAEAEAARDAGDEIAYGRARRRYLLLQAVAYVKARAGGGR